MRIRTEFYSFSLVEGVWGARDADADAEAGGRLEALAAAAAVVGSETPSIPASVDAGPGKPASPA